MKHIFITCISLAFISYTLYSCKPSGEVEMEEEVAVIPEWKNPCEGAEQIEAYTLKDVKVVLVRRKYLDTEVAHFRIIDSLTNKEAKIEYKNPEMSFLFLAPLPNNLPAEFNSPNTGKELVVSGIQYITPQVFEEAKKMYIGAPGHGDGPPPVSCFTITSIRAL